MKHLALLFLAAATSLPAAAQYSSSTYAAQLVAQTLVKYPDVLAVTLLARPPKSANAVVASNVAPVGAPPMASQLAVLANGHPIQEIIADGAQVSSTLALQDVSGDAIGTVTVVQALAATADQDALLRRAESIRDELRRKVINAANLSDPVPYVAGFSFAPYAQQLVDHTMNAHPELLVVALHVATLSGDDYPIIASSIGRIGKKADDDDMRVIVTGEPATGAYGANKTRFGIELPMHDTTGKLIGALSVGYAFKPGDDEQALLRQARQVETELRARIPSLARLYGAAL